MAGPRAFDELRTRARQVTWLRKVWRAVVHTIKSAGQEVQITPLRRPPRRPAPTRRPPELLVSMTSFPARIEHAWIPIERVLRGDHAPDLVVLVLAEEEFPGRRLPRRLVQLQDRGLEVIWTADNSHAYKKLGPTRLAYPDATIVTIDDDAMYAPWMLARLVTESLRHPGTVIGHRGRMVDHDADGLTDYGEWVFVGLSTPSGLVLLTGVGGILYPPGVLPVDLLVDSDLALELAPTADDIWCWALEQVSHTPVRCLGTTSFRPLERQEATPALQDVNFSERRNERQLARVIDYFGIALPPGPARR